MTTLGHRQHNPLFAFGQTLRLVTEAVRTLHPAPDTLHHTPYTLLCTQHPLHPTPYTLHPAPCTTPSSRSARLRASSPRRSAPPLSNLPHTGHIQHSQASEPGLGLSLFSAAQPKPQILTALSQTLRLVTEAVRAHQSRNSRICC